MTCPPKAGRPTLPEAVTHWAALRPHAVALQCGGSAMTWSELDDAMTRFGAALIAHGVGMGDRVVLLGENSLEWVIAFLGCQRAQMIVVPMNTRLAHSQIVQQICKVDAKALLHDAGLAPPDVAALTGAECLELETLLQGTDNGPHARGAEASEPAVGDVPALISFTSGTTGTPKGAVITNSALSELAHAFSSYFGTGPDDSTLIIVPIFHNTGFADQLAHMVASGGTTNLLRRYRTDDAAAELIAHPATFLAAVPSMLRMLMLHDDADAIFDGVATIMYGGSAIPEAWVHELLRRWPHLKLVHAYGLSEFTSVCTFLPSELAPTKAESAGRPLPGVELRIVGELGHDVEPGELGEVWVCGPTCMLGYWREPELTAAKLSTMATHRRPRSCRLRGPVVAARPRRRCHQPRGREDHAYVRRVAHCPSRNRRSRMRLRVSRRHPSTAGRGGGRNSVRRCLRRGRHLHIPPSISTRLRDTGPVGGL